MSMVRFGCHPLPGMTGLIAGFTLSLAFTQPCPAQRPTSGANTSEHASRMNCGAQIECITPDGHLARISRSTVQDPAAAALIMEDDTVTCALREGETNFVIELPDQAVPDRFTFLNENGKARGELKISVSNRRLAPNSSEWKEVEGIIPFAHKRLFGVSLIGIGAKYVRLSFRVETPTGLRDTEGLTNVAAASKASHSFDASALDDALDSSLAPKAKSSPVLLSYITGSVAPLN